VLYIASMWIAGVMEGLMWRAVGDDGTLTYTFVEAVKAKYPFYAIRLLGGLLFLSGICLMMWNVVLTIKGQVAVNPEVPLKNPDARDPALVGPTPVLA